VRRRRNWRPREYDAMKYRYLILLLATCIASCTVETRVDSDESDTLAAEADSAIPSSRDTAVAGTRLPRPDSLWQSASDEVDGARLYPVDEADQDPSFFAYRMRLMDAVVRRDAEALFELTSPNIRASFGDAAGHQGIREMWDPDDPQSELWETLGTVLSGGGTFMDEQYVSGDVEAAFQAPYYYARFPGERFDAFQSGIIVVDEVVVRSEPREDASAIDTVGFQIVGVESLEPVGTVNDRWIGVELDDDRSGYVPASAVESPIGYRAVFQKHDGQWQMMAFVAGD